MLGRFNTLILIWPTTCVLKLLETSLRQGANTGTHTILATRGRGVQVAAAEHIAAALCGVTVLKVDIEGAEYGMEDFIVSCPTVRIVGAELHFRKKRNAADAKRFVDILQAGGFRPAIVPNLQNVKLWHTYGLWVRTM